MALRRPRSTGETEALAKRPRGRPYKFRQGAWEAAARRLDGSAWRGLLLVCPEQHAMQVILHVGEPDTERRRVPAALLSVPTQLTRPQTVQVAAEQAISSELLSLARHLQPSAANGARVALRGELLRSALNAMGCDLWSLENHGCLAALHLPYTSQEVSVAKDDDERYLRQLCNKLDLCPTAYGRCSSLHDVAQLLERQCKVTLAPKLLTPEAQLAMRRKLGVGIPLQVKDAFGATVHVLLCTEEVHVYNEGPRLVFSDTPQAAPQAPAAPPPAQQREGWFCFSSRKTGQLYYWNEVTNVSTMDPLWSASGLSDGWKCQVDGKTGRLHFHHSQHGETTRLP